MIALGSSDIVGRMDSKIEKIERSGWVRPLDGIVTVFEGLGASDTIN